MRDGVELAQSTAIARFDLRFDSRRIHCGVLHFLIAVYTVSLNAQKYTLGGGVVMG